MDKDIQKIVDQMNKEVYDMYVSEEMTTLADKYYKFAELVSGVPRAGAEPVSTQEEADEIIENFRKARIRYLMNLKILVRHLENEKIAMSKYNIKTFGEKD